MSKYINRDVTLSPHRQDGDMIKNRSILKSIISLFFILIFILGSVNNLKAEDVCYIQVDGPPNIKIYLDDIYMGITGVQPNDSGLYIQNVIPGRHIIIAIKEDFHAQKVEIYIKPNEVYRYVVLPLNPKIEVRQVGPKSVEPFDKKVGKLIVRSLPIECEISIPSIIIMDNVKEEDRWIIDSIPEGEYKLIGKTPNNTLDTLITIKTGYELNVMLNFINNSIKIDNFFVPNKINIVKIPDGTIDSSQIVNVIISKENLTISSLFYKLGIVPDSTLNSSMLRVAEIRYYSPAYRGKIFVGDIVKSFNGKNIKNESDLFNNINSLPVDSTYELVIGQELYSRYGNIKTITITIKE